ncbi:MAG TPA: tetratricopeptide repeat protein [Candidatus Acidoferrum sp.]
MLTEGFDGRRSEALAELAKIEQLDYSFSSANTESYVYYALRDYPALIEASKRGLLLDPRDSSQHYYLGVGYEGTGELQKAISEYQQAMQLSDGDPDPAVALAHAYSAFGKKAEAQNILHGLESKEKRISASPYTMATIYAGLGENDKAFEFLEKAYSEKSLDFPLPPQSDPRMDRLHADPRFQTLVRRLPLQNQTLRAAKLAKGIWGLDYSFRAGDGVLRRQWRVADNSPRTLFLRFPALLCAGIVDQIALLGVGG